MIKVSIIIPIYNTKKYLKKCIDSVINQSEKNIEILLINDGSKEKIEDIINLYNDSRIKYFKRSNHGIGKTRNFGIEKSKGDYIMFVDSDDYILPKCVEMLYKKAIETNSDLIVSDFYEERNGNFKEINFNDFEVSSLKEKPTIINEINLGPCNKLYKKELIINNNIKFEENLKYEDAPFVCKSFMYAKRISKINEKLFVYVIHEKSETTTIDKRIFDILDICDLIIKELSKFDYLKEIKTNLIVMILSDYMMKQRFVGSKKARKKFINKSFDKLNNFDRNWKKCTYLKRFNFFKRKIKTNKTLLNLYCDCYHFFKTKKK